MSLHKIRFTKKHHFQDEKYKEKIESPIKSCEVLISIAMSSFCGINRICKIASFTGDGLVRVLLKLDKAINENRACELTEGNAISAALKKLGQGILSIYDRGYTNLTGIE